MPTLPVVNVTRPAVLTGQTNGKLDPSILLATPGQAGGPTVWLVAPAVRAWRAMCAAAARAGHVLKATGLTDSYRDYARQERIFRERYTTTFLSGRPWKLWQGRRWYQRPGTAVAAVPGTSNHGWGLAIDIGEERDGDVGTESIDAATVAWLVANARLFGYSAEVQSEPWHWRYFAGDRIPVAVIEFEGDDDMTPEQSAKLDAIFQLLVPDPPVRVQGAWSFTRPDGRSVPINPLYSALDHVAELVEKVALESGINPKVLDAVKAAAASGAEAGVVAGVDELVAAFVAALPDDVASREDVVSALREVLRTGVGVDTR